MRSQMRLHEAAAADDEDADLPLPALFGGSSQRLIVAKIFSSTLQARARALFVSTAGLAIHRALGRVRPKVCFSTGDTGRSGIGVAASRDERWQPALPERGAGSHTHFIPRWRRQIAISQDYPFITYAAMPTSTTCCHGAQDA
ncbi:unnamed protein product [Urochloa humidicola]